MRELPIMPEVKTVDLPLLPEVMMKELPTLLTYGPENLTSEAGERSDLQFDSRLLAKWNRLMEAGHFRYTTSNKVERVLPGGQRYLAQFQPHRARLRRTPQAMEHLAQPFQAGKFNFNKIDEGKELICELRNVSREQDEKTRDLLIINVSPIDLGHCLLVPRVEAGHNQVLTLHSCRLALEMMQLSASPDLRLAFNSLCAYASVNHLHWHTYYLNHRCAVQSLPLTQLGSGPLHTLHPSPPAPAWVLLLDQGQLDLVARNMVRLTSWLTDSDIAHNVFIARGAGAEGGEDSRVVRVVVWPREAVRGAKDPGQFVMAVCELSGQVLVYDEEKYLSLQEEEVVAAQEETAGDLMAKLGETAVALYQF